jgi:NitT/TauT family transport system substrate-binding protein
MDAKNLEGSTVITKAPDSDAYTNTYIKKALGELKSENVDTTGADFKPIDVTLAEGGK